MKLVPQQAVTVAQVSGPNTQQWGMGAGDLGVMWNDGPTVFHVFGDNFGSLTHGGTATDGPTGPDWKPNALGRSSNWDLNNGVTFDNFNVDSNGDRTPPLPLINNDDGTVPCGGIHIGQYDVMSYMCFPHGHTDFSQTRVGGTAYSTDGGNTWYRSNAYWDNNAAYTDVFQQSAFAYDGGQYVYRFTTPSARAGDIHLLRCPATPDSSIITKTAYQYWTGSAWSSDPTQVGVLIPGPAGEMSAQYDDLLQQWMVIYHDDPAGAVMFRSAPSPTGPWSPKMSIMDDSVMAVYAPMFHPKSQGTGLYFCGSEWGSYEVYLFYANLNVYC